MKNEIKQNITKTFRVIAFTEKDRHLQMVKRYVDNIEIVKNIDEIQWKDIICRRVRLVSMPSRSELTNKSQLCKRTLAKVLNLGIGDFIGNINFEDCLLGEHGDKVFFAPMNSAVLIYKYHLGKDFSVLELKDELHERRMKNIVNKSRHARELGLLDVRQGLTVFTNLRNDTLLRAYKRIHPNRKIILRYHDRLDGGLGGKSGQKQKILAMIAKLKQDKIIDEVESYFRPDAEAMAGKYRPNAVNSDALSGINFSFCEAFYRFIGAPKDVKDRTRLDAINDLKKELMRLYPKINHWIEERMVLNSAEWMPYCDYLEKIFRTEVIVDLTRFGQNEGFSFRIPEALFLNKKIITNRLIVRDEPFYSSERIFLVGIDSVSRLKEFLEKEVEPLPNSILRLYDTHFWWTDNDPIKELNK